MSKPTNWIVIETTAEPKDVAYAMMLAKLPHGLCVHSHEVTYAQARCECGAMLNMPIGSNDGPNELCARLGLCMVCDRPLSFSPYGVDMPFAIDWNAMPKTASRAHWQTRSA